MRVRVCVHGACVQCARCVRACGVCDACVRGPLDGIGTTTIARDEGSHLDTLYKCIFKMRTILVFVAALFHKPWHQTHSCAFMCACVRNAIEQGAERTMYTEHTVEN